MTATGTEVEPVAMTAANARETIDKIRGHLADAWHLAVKSYEGRAWIALGYESWDAMCDAEFDEVRCRIPREKFADTVTTLADSGMPVRAIAAATGTSKSTVARQVSQSGTGDDDRRVVGLDGKSYQRRRPGHHFHSAKVEAAQKIRREWEAAKTQQQASDNAVTLTVVQTELTGPQERAAEAVRQTEANRRERHANPPEPNPAKMATIKSALRTMPDDDWTDGSAPRSPACSATRSAASTGAETQSMPTRCRSPRAT